MPAKKTEYKHRYVEMTDRQPNEREQDLLVCVLNVGGGVRRPFYAEYVTNFRDPKGPMARHVVRVSDWSIQQAHELENDPEDFGGTTIKGFPMEKGDYVVYGQEILEVIGVEI